MHNFIPLVSTSSAIKAGHNDLLSACKVSSPADPEDIIHFLTTGSCIPGKKVPQNSGINSPCILISSIWNTIIADNFQPVMKIIIWQIKLSKQEKYHSLTPYCCFVWTLKAIPFFKMSTVNQESRLDFVLLPSASIRNFHYFDFKQVVRNPNKILFLCWHI